MIEGIMGKAKAAGAETWKRAQAAGGAAKEAVFGKDFKTAAAEIEAEPEAPAVVENPAEAPAQSREGKETREESIERVVDFIDSHIKSEQESSPSGQITPDLYRMVFKNDRDDRENFVNYCSSLGLDWVTLLAGRKEWFERYSKNGPEIKVKNPYLPPRAG